MAKKKKETKVKHREIAQKEDLQELQGDMDAPIEDSDIVEGMVRCKSCKKDVEPYPVENNR